MIGEEQQQTIDINKISLPVSESVKKSNGDGKNNVLKVGDGKSSTSAVGNKTDLDLRLNMLFGSSGDKSQNGKADSKETRKENFTNTAVSALEKDLAKLDAAKKEEKNSRSKEGAMEEEYDPEREYQEASARILNEAKLNDQNLKEKGVNAMHLLSLSDSKERKKKASPDKKVMLI